MNNPPNGIGSSLSKTLLDRLSFRGIRPYSGYLHYEQLNPVINKVLDALDYDWNLPDSCDPILGVHDNDYPGKDLEHWLIIISTNETIKRI